MRIKYPTYLLSHKKILKNRLLILFKIGILKV